MNLEEFRSEQLAGLACLADILRHYEVNFMIMPPGSDMGYIEMVGFPTLSGLQAVYDPYTKTYDIWKQGRKRLGMKERNLSVEDAAEILSSTYFVAKAKGIHKRHPEVSMTEIMRALKRGYQSAKQNPGRTAH